MWAYIKICRNIVQVLNILITFLLLTTNTASIDNLEGKKVLSLSVTTVPKQKI